MDESSAILAPHRRRIGYFALVALAGIAVVETLNSARILATPMARRPFPQGYVSMGVWSAYALVRPLHATSTDIAPALRASNRTAQRDDRLYAEFSRVGAANFLYPPTAAVELLPFGWMLGWAGMARTTQLMDLLGRLSALVLLLLTLWCLRGFLCRRWEWMLAILVFAAFCPIRWALLCVQVQSFINVFLAGAMLAYAHRRGTLAGVLIGLAGGLKPYLAPLVLFAIARRQWKMALSAVATGVGLILISLWLVGTGPWRTYLTGVLPVMSAGYATQGNQTFNALARRWRGDSYAFELSPATPGVTVFTRCAAAVLVVVSLMPRSLRGSTCVNASTALRQEHACGVELPGEVLYRSADMGIALLALTMGSPIAWDHYYGWTVVLFCVCFAAGRVVPIPSRVFVLLGVCYALLGTCWVPMGAGHPGLFSLLDSKMLFASMALLAAAWYVCRRLSVETWGCRGTEEHSAGSWRR